MTVDWKDIFTIGLATLGAGLGIINTAMSLSTRWLRVRVRPSFITDIAGNPLGASIEVTNLSAFPVSIAEVGFEAGKGRHLPLIHPGQNLPRRLEARDSLSVTFAPRDFIPPSGVTVGSAYARTACGRYISGSSPAGKQLSEMLSSISQGVS